MPQFSLGDAAKAAIIAALPLARFVKGFGFLSPQPPGVFSSDRANPLFSFAKSSFAAQCLARSMPALAESFPWAAKSASLKSLELRCPTIQQGP